MQPTHGGQHWTETPGNGAAQAGGAAFLADDGAGNWDVVTTGTSTAVAVDLGDGQFLTVETDTPYVILDDGTQYLTASSGTAGAVLADDGNGGFLVAAVGATVAGSLLLDAGTGDLLPVRDDALELRFAQIGTTSLLSFP